MVARTKPTGSPVSRYVELECLEGQSLTFCSLLQAARTNPNTTSAGRKHAKHELRAMGA